MAFPIASGVIGLRPYLHVKQCSRPFLPKWLPGRWPVLVPFAALLKPFCFLSCRLARSAPDPLKPPHHRAKTRPIKKAAPSVRGGSWMDDFPAGLLGRLIRHVGKHGPCDFGTLLLAALVEDQLVASARDTPDLGHRAAGTGRDEAADDHVLLEALQRVDLAGDGRLGQHAWGFLEGGGGDEGRRLQRGLGDAEQPRLAFRRLLALLDKAFVDFLELDRL